MKPTQAMALLSLAGVAFVQAGHAQGVEAVASPFGDPSLLWRKVAAAPTKVIPSPLNGMPHQALANLRERQARLREQQAREARQRQILKYEQDFIPQDPWRALNGTTNFVKGPGWLEFRGKVIEVQPGGICVVGDFGKPFTLREPAGREFLVTNFPDRVAVGDYVGLQHQDVAFDAGTCAHETPLEGSRTMVRLDYGIPCQPPPAAIEAAKRAARQRMMEARKARQKALKAEKRAQEAALRWDQSLADKGDPYGLLRMGERYSDGDGVPKDPARALDYFCKALAAGAPSVPRQLSGLHQPTNGMGGK